MGKFFSCGRVVDLILTFVFLEGVFIAVPLIRKGRLLASTKPTWVLSTT